MVNLTIDGKTIEVKEGTTVLQAARSVGIHIPTLCDHPKLTPYGGCRLCVVEIQGFRIPMASCTIPVAPGMVVQTDTEKLRKARKFILTMLFSERNHFCPFCLVSGGDCELQNAAYEQEMTHWPLQPAWNKFTVDASSPYFVLDNNRCIVCRRCVRACAELPGNYTLGISERGAHSLLLADNGVPIGDSTCVACGSCVQACPTGALMHRHSAYLGHDTQVEHVFSTCLGCSVGCNVDIQTRDNQIVRIDADWNIPQKKGVLCKTGRFLPLYDDRKRVTAPMVRKNGKLEPVAWSEAMDLVATRLQPLKNNAGNGVAAMISTRLPVESMTLFKQVFQQGLKSDMVTGVEEGRPSALPAALADQMGHPFEGKIFSAATADCVITIGADLAESHQVLGFLVKRNLPSGARLIVIDPNENGFDPFATYSLKATHGTDKDIVEGLMAAVIKQGLAKSSDPMFSDVDKVLDAIPEKTGLSTQELLKAAYVIGSCERPFIVYGKGITHQPVATLEALVDFAKLIGATTGERYGLLSIKGEANSMAAAQLRLDQPFRLNGHQAAYIAIGDDFPTQRLNQRLENVPFLVVQASYESPLTEKADVVLPVSTWAEQEGHYLNLEGNLQKAKKVINSPDDVRTNQEVLKQLAEHLGIQTSDEWRQELHLRTPSAAITEMN